MHENVKVHDRIRRRHPELEEKDVRSAWHHAMVVVERLTASFPADLLVAVGSDSKNRLIEMVATVEEDGTVCIFHAMTPPSRKTLRETGLRR